MPPLFGGQSAFLKVAAFLAAKQTFFIAWSLWRLSIHKSETFQDRDKACVAQT